MRLTLTTPAVVLRSRPYGESDKIVCFLTENYGKITGIAKGAKRSRKRFANSLEPFSIINLHFQDPYHGSLAFLVSAELTVVLKRLGESLEKIAIASYLAEIIDGLFGERDQNPVVFQQLKNGLLLLETADTALLEFLTSFELNLLAVAGYRPALDACKNCARLRIESVVGRWYFSLSDGGILCATCAQPCKENLSLGAAALVGLATLQQQQDERTGGPGPIPIAALTEIRFIMQRFLEFHMEREIRSAPFLSRFVAR